MDDLISKADLKRLTTKRNSIWNEITDAEGRGLDKILDSMPTAAPRWIPVTDRLPEPKDGVLIYTSYDFIDIGWFRADGDWDSELGCYDHKNITHWMPLPDPPKEESCNNKCE